MPPKNTKKRESANASLPQKKRARHNDHDDDERPKGVHKMKADQLTGTKYDTWRHKDLKQACQNRGLWRKDMPKAEAAKALADDDERLKNESQQQRVRDIERKQQEDRQKELRRERLEAQEKRREERQKKIDEGADPEQLWEEEEFPEEVYGIETFGQIEESEYESTTSNDSDVEPPISPVGTHQRLRIFEWPFPELPSPGPPKTPTSANAPELPPETLPQRLTYKVMVLATSKTKEYVELPGRNMPTGFRPDFVPRLSPTAMLGVRNGHLIQELRFAKVTSAKDWNKRTHVQWWNGRMYFTSIPLEELSAQSPKSPKTPKSSRSTRKPSADATKTAARNKKQLAVQINSQLIQSDHPVCYMPAFLNYPYLQYDEEDIPQTLDNLFYVSFPGNDVPHYYFWTRPDQWQNPLRPNPTYDYVKDRDLALQKKEAAVQTKRKICGIYPAPRQAPRSGHTWYPYSILKDQIRVRKTSFGGQPPTFNMWDGSRYSIGVEYYEGELFEYGLGKTLEGVRQKWFAKGLVGDWEFLTDYIMDVFPDASMPTAPPVHSSKVFERGTPRSIAEKIAALEHPRDDLPMSPIRGDEPWTRADDYYWDVVSDAEEVGAFPSSSWRFFQVGNIEEAVQQELLDERMRQLAGEKLNMRRPSLPDPRAPPQSVAGMAHRHKNRNNSSALPRTFEEFDAWVQDISPTDRLGDREIQTPPMYTPINKALRAFQRQRWERLLAKNAEDETVEQDPYDLEQPSPQIKHQSREMIPELIKQVEDLPPQGLKVQLYTLLEEKLKESNYCRVCLEPCESRDQNNISEHYEQHKTQVSDACPFCGIRWPQLESRMKHAHINSHDFSAEEGVRSMLSLWSPSPLAKRRRTTSNITSTDVSTASKKRVALPTDITTEIQPSRHPSKVKFSPNTVEKRTAYNDLSTSATDPGLNADIDSPLRQKSLLKKGRTTKKTKPSLKIKTTSASSAPTNPKSKLTAHISGKRATRNHANDLLHTTYSAIDDDAFKPPSTASSGHTPSPVLHMVKRKPGGHPDAAFKPRKDSLVSEVESPVQKKRAVKTGTSRKVTGRKRKVVGAREVEDGEQRASSAVSKRRKVGKVADATFQIVASPKSGSDVAVENKGRANGRGVSSKDFMAKTKTALRKGATPKTKAVPSTKSSAKELKTKSGRGTKATTTAYVKNVAQEVEPFTADYIPFDISSPDTTKSPIDAGWAKVTSFTAIEASGNRVKESGAKTMKPKLITVSKMASSKILV